MRLHVMGNGGAVFREKTINVSLDGVSAKVVYHKHEGFETNTLLVSFDEAHRVFSTSEGCKRVPSVGITHIPNALFRHMIKSCDGFEKACPAYLEDELKNSLAATLGLPRRNVAFLSTAVSMNDLVVVEQSRQQLRVCCFVTAGAKNNALRTGVDEASWVERNGAFENMLGTINIIILTNCVLTAGAMVKAVITATEAKTAALQDLNVPSTYTPLNQATGTGTDNVIIVSGAPAKSFPSKNVHPTISGLIGSSTKTAVAEALKKHDGTKSNLREKWNTCWKLKLNVFAGKSKERDF
ncbi:MAG: adenosylcobinamide amidohydrolase [Candidatus Bathyarchaeota archaeon]|nr:adenosylcobinamide amidohydrolase [Candidatus Bathyarchaeota archaeon]